MREDANLFYFSEHGKNFAQMYKVLCDDETDYNSNCALTWTTLGSVSLIFFR